MCRASSAAVSELEQPAPAKNKTGQDKKSRPGVSFVDPRSGDYSLRCIKPDKEIVRKFGKHIFIFMEEGTTNMVSYLMLIFDQL